MKSGHCESECFRSGMFHHESKVSSSLGLVHVPCRELSEDNRKPRRFRPSWLYCRVQNCCEEPLFIYGPRHRIDCTFLSTSLFLLESGASTPARWDCKGVLIPFGRRAWVRDLMVEGPVALKYRDLRRVRISMAEGIYHCPRADRMLTKAQSDFSVPPLSFEELIACRREQVSV